MYSCTNNNRQPPSPRRRGQGESRVCRRIVLPSILHSVKRTFVAGAIASLLLAGCAGGTKEAQKITAARQALLYAGQLMRTGKISQDIFRPSALLGVHTALFLAKTAESSVKTALQGVTIQQALRAQGGENVSEAFRLLTALSDALEVDIADMLNRTPERQESLDAYVTALTSYFNAAKTQTELLAQEQREKEADAKAKRAAATTISRDLSRARSNKDYTTVSQKQEQLIQAQTEQTTADAEVREVKTTLNVMNELIDVTSQRLSAIAENREIILSGLSVVEVPGIDDLGLIIQRNSRRSGGNNPLGEM